MSQRGGMGARSLWVAGALGGVLVFGAGCSSSPAPPASAPAPVSVPASVPAPAPAPVPVPPAGQRQLTIWLTGYSWQDNTPPGSSIVGEPVLHKEAGGTGTFADPITVASTGHQGDQQWTPGTKFYLPTVQRYVLVEDSGAAKAPAGTDSHLDMWIGGQDGTEQATNDCESTFTGRVPAMVNPPTNLPVMAGPIFADQRCNIPPQPANMGTYDDPGGGHHGHH